MLAVGRPAREGMNRRDVAGGVHLEDGAQSGAAPEARAVEEAVGRRCLNEGAGPDIFRCADANDFETLCARLSGSRQHKNGPNGDADSRNRREPLGFMDFSSCGPPSTRGGDKSPRSPGDTARNAEKSSGISHGSLNPADRRPRRSPRLPTSSERSVWSRPSSGSSRGRQARPVAAPSLRRARVPGRSARGTSSPRKSCSRGSGPACSSKKATSPRTCSCCACALTNGASGHEYIETIPRRGYRFAVPVREISRRRATRHPPNGRLPSRGGGKPTPGARGPHEGGGTARRGPLRSFARGSSRGSGSGRRRGRLGPDHGRALHRRSSVEDHGLRSRARTIWAWALADAVITRLGHLRSLRVRPTASIRSLDGPVAGPRRATAARCESTRYSRARSSGPRGAFASRRS